MIMMCEAPVVSSCRLRLYTCGYRSQIDRFGGTHAPRATRALVEQSSFDLGGHCDTEYRLMRQFAEATSAAPPALLSASSVKSRRWKRVTVARHICSMFEYRAQNVRQTVGNHSSDYATVTYGQGLTSMAIEGEANS